MALLQAFLVFLAVLSGNITAARDSYPHVRMTQPRLASLVEDAARRSPTFASLVQRLQNSDVVVFAETTTMLAAHITGHTILVKATAAVRYVRSEVRADAPERDIVVAIAHELQHAVEIAASGVRDDGGVEHLFERIGHRHATGFETDAAQTVASQVRRELAQRPPVLRAARPAAPEPLLTAHCAIS